MNITLILPYLKAGGTERQAAYIANYLQDKGHKVSTISVEKVDFFEPYFKVPVHYLSSRNNYFYLVFNILLIISIVRRENSDVIISRAWSTNLLCTMASILTGIPNVLFLSASLDMSNHSFFKKLIYRLMLRKTDHIVSVSDATKRNCIKWFGINKNKISVIHNGVDVENIQKLSQDSIDVSDELLDKTTKKLVFVGRLIERKGLDLLLKSLKSVKKYYNVQLIVVGEGEKSDEYKQMCSNFNIVPDVVFLGEKKNPFPYLNLGDIFILSSRSEGFPNVLLEAMAMGKTVIATNCKNGPNEIIDNNNGTLVEVDNPEHLTKAIINYLENPNLAKIHAENAKKTVEQSFKLGGQLTKIEQIVKTLSK